MLSGRSIPKLFFGVMLLFVVGVTACSVGIPAATNQDEVEFVGRDIKVYESPT